METCNAARATSVFYKPLISTFNLSELWQCLSGLQYDHCIQITRTFKLLCKIVNLAINRHFNSMSQPFCFYKSQLFSTDSLLCLHAVKTKSLACWCRFFLSCYPGEIWRILTLFGDSKKSCLATKLEDLFLAFNFTLIYSWIVFSCYLDLVSWN